MEADRLKILLEKYYTGDILPNEYQSLLSALKESDELAPELNAERRMLLAIESCEAAVPEGLEDRLVMAINNRSKRRRNFLRMLYSGSAAAIVMVVMIIGTQEISTSSSNANEDLEKSAKVVDDALLDVLGNIHLAQNEVINAYDNMEISQPTDYNFM